MGELGVDLFHPLHVHLWGWGWYLEKCSTVFLCGYLEKLSIVCVFVLEKCLQVVMRVDVQKNVCVCLCLRL